MGLYGPGSFRPMIFLVFGIRFQNGAKDSIPKRCKGVHSVDLGESFPTSIYLQNLASIQPRKSFVKFARSPRTDTPVRIIIIIITDTPGPAWVRLKHDWTLDKTSFLWGGVIIHFDHQRGDFFFTDYLDTRFQWLRGRKIWKGKTLNWKHRSISFRN